MRCAAGTCVIGLLLAMALGRYPRNLFYAWLGWVGGSGWSLTINSSPVGVVGWYPLSPWDRSA